MVNIFRNKTTHTPLGHSHTSLTGYITISLGTMPPATGPLSPGWPSKLTLPNGNFGLLEPKGISNKDTVEFKIDEA